MQTLLLTKGIFLSYRDRRDMLMMLARLDGKPHFQTFYAEHFREALFNTTVCP